LLVVLKDTLTMNGHMDVKFKYTQGIHFALSTRIALTQTEML